MGKVYKDKKGSSCKMCKPHKNGFEPKHKDKHRSLEKESLKDISEYHETQQEKYHYFKKDD